MHYVYVLLLNSKKRVYIGSTTDLVRRISEHRRGVVASTKNRFNCLLYFEKFDTKKESLAKEKWLKTGIGRKWLHDHFKTNSGLVAKW